MKYHWVKVTNGNTQEFIKILVFIIYLFHDNYDEYASLYINFRKSTTNFCILRGHRRDEEADVERQNIEKILQKIFLFYSPVSNRKNNESCHVSLDKESYQKCFLSARERIGGKIWLIQKLKQHLTCDEIAYIFNTMVPES